MSQTFRWFITASLTLILGCACRSKPTSGIPELISQSVALVRDGHPYCSGTWVAPRRILTARHCIIDENDIGIMRHENDTMHVAIVVKMSEAWDLALLETGPMAHGIAMLGEVPDVGDPVRAVGTPLGLWNSFSAGHVSGLRRSSDGFEWIQATVPIAPGSSGGGLFDARGRLIGVSQAVVTRAPNISVHISTLHVRAFLI